MNNASARICMLVFFLLVLTVSTFGQEGKPPQPKISLSETMWDFGYVPKTGTVSHTYRIKNIGDDTLIIVKVRTTCGCTTAPLSKQRLAPDEMADMEAVFDPRRIKVGETSKRLQVISDDPDNPFTDVRFSAKVGMSNSLVRLTPTELNFDTVSQGTEEVRSLTLENISGEKLFIDVIEGPGHAMDADLEARNLEPGESVQIHLKLKENAASGNLQTSLTLDFECSKVARVSIPIFGVIISD
ncbi:MAG: DUF1573 domain-containing protein [candidate division Zixibacteria bacterium]|nr:DUF1573 domain-containing protein [candidate division Zixibacteria bacterium]